MNSTKTERKLRRASSVFAPTFPRQSSDGHTMQAKRYDRSALVSAMQQAREAEQPGYYSVYSFPRGHSRERNIPRIDCIFIDLDVADGNYKPNDGQTDFGSWKTDMSALLTRSRSIAQAIIDAGREQHFRAVLSGHKGLHIYLDFPTVAPNNGTFQQFKNGLSDYSSRVMDWLSDTAGVHIQPWIDVDASDLGRLARHPNTPHFGAAYDDTQRWAVPVTVAELSKMDVDNYLELTRGPRWHPRLEGRNPSTSAGQKVVQSIRSASGSQNSHSGGSTVDYGAIERYEDECNEEIELDDVLFLTKNKPCIKAFRERDDAYEHGNASHTMELSIIVRLVEIGTPRDVIHEFFADIPGYDEEMTDRQINKIVARDYNNWSCSTIADDAPTFCLGNDCQIYRRGEDIQK